MAGTCYRPTLIVSRGYVAGKLANCDLIEWFIIGKHLAQSSNNQYSWRNV